MLKKRVVSLLIAMLLFLHMTCQVAAETGVKIDLQNSGEDADIPVEEWVYTPQIETSETAPVLNSDGSEGTDSEEKMIEVHVKATKRGADKVTSVGGRSKRTYYLLPLPHAAARVPAKPCLNCSRGSLPVSVD